MIFEVPIVYYFSGRAKSSFIPIVSITVFSKRLVFILAQTVSSLSMIPHWNPNHYEDFYFKNCNGTKKSFPIEPNSVHCVLSLFLHSETNTWKLTLPRSVSQLDYTTTFKITGYWWSYTKFVSFASETRSTTKHNTCRKDMFHCDVTTPWKDSRPECP